MAHGDQAAEQHEKDQPSEVGSCLRPDGAKPELEPLKDRYDFQARMRQALGKRRILSDLRQDAAQRSTALAARNASYADEQLARLDVEMDQLVLMRSAQILDEAEQRRRDVMAKFARKPGTD